jgi:hypothetical protein
LYLMNSPFTARGKAMAAGAAGCSLPCHCYKLGGP